VFSKPHATSRGFRLPWSPRTILIQAPLHLVAFALLYLAVFHLIMGEVSMTYESDSGLLLADTVNSIHPAMVCSDANDLQQRLDEFVASHRVLGLSLFDAEGKPISPESADEPGVAAFLSAGKNRQVRIFEKGRLATLTAMAKIRATPECEPCHPRGAVLGAAVVTRDISNSLKATRSRAGRGLAVLVAGWIALVAVVNLASRRLAWASVDALKARVAAEPSAPARSPSVTLGMDSLSQELYRSLERTLREHHEERATMESRFADAERLASMGQLAAGLAHEIKNPLAGVQGALELLVEECGNDERIELYRRMLEELRRVNETLHSLLHFARPRKPRRVTTDIRDLLEDVAGLVRPGFSRRNITLTVAVDEHVRTFTLDPGQIRQVIVNLITNAADAIGDPGTIELLATPFPEGDGLILAVVDDGHGMDKETQKRVFEPFFTTKLHGTGLGLAVASKIVEEHGGSIEVSSAPGEGTTVFLLLPDPAHGSMPAGQREA